MAESLLNEVVYSGNVVEFATVAHEYCRFVEKTSTRKAREFLEKIQKLLPLIYLKASLLPSTDGSGDDPEKFVNEVTYHVLQQQIMELLGPYDDYQEVFDPEMQFSEAPLHASISENLADIYQDLKDFTMAYRLGDEQIMQEALRICRDNFQDYWGQRLANCLRAVHALVYGTPDFDAPLEPEE